MKKKSSLTFSRRKFLFGCAACSIAASTLSASRIFAADAGAKKPLVVYYTITGNTAKIAEMIHNKVGGDLVRIETVNAYPDSYHDLTDQAKKEQAANFRPEIKNPVINLDDYGVVYLGSPNWWSSLAMPVWTFVEKENFANKMVAPFVTHGGGGLANCVRDLQKLAPQATVLTPLVVSGSSVGRAQADVDKWLATISKEAGA